MLDFFNYLLLFFIIVTISILLYVTFEYAIVALFTSTMILGGEGPACHISNLDEKESPIKLDSVTNTVIIDARNFIGKMNEQLGHIQIPSIASVANPLIVQMIALFKKIYPSIKLHIVNKNYKEQFDSNGYQILVPTKDKKFNYPESIAFAYNVVKVYTDVVFHIAYDENEGYHRVKGHHEKGRDDALAIIIQDETKEEKSILISYDNYRDIASFTSIKPFWRYMIKHDGKEVVVVVPEKKTNPGRLDPYKKITFNSLYDPSRHYAFRFTKQSDIDTLGLSIENGSIYIDKFYTNEQHKFPCLEFIQEDAPKWKKKAS